MNWYAVRIVALVAVGLACIVASAFTMANLEYGSTRTAAKSGAVVLALISAWGLLLGSVV